MRIRNYEDLTNHGNVKGRKMAVDIIEAGLDAGNPYNNTLKLLSIKDNKLIFDCKEMEVVGDPRSGPAVYDLDKIDRIFIFAVGKGILYMVKALEDVIGDHVTGGLAIGKHGDEAIVERVDVTFGSHPVPDIHGVEGCRKMMEMIASLNLTENDLAITVMGNGCSALACLPDEGITVEDVEFLNQYGLIDNGMNTEAMSYLRNQIDCFRGGRMLRALRPAQIVNLLGIGPGGAARTDPIYATPYESFLRNNLWLPNISDCTTPDGAIDIAKQWGVFDGLPESIQKKLLSNPEVSETLSYEEYESYNCRLFAVMPANMSALNASIAKAEEYGFETHYINSYWHVESAPVGGYVAQMARQIQKTNTPYKAPCALFETGELVVTVNGEAGIGGTNQEFCAYAATFIDGNKRIVIAAVDTDGTDGPGGNFSPDAQARGINCLTGGVVDGYTAAAAKEKGIDLFTACKTHDTSKALWDLGSGIAAVQDISVGDLHCILILDEDG
ncbi:MAG: DUF4147 domain-containing protein [Oscillospiraceae bacterium]|nr:DUF4147 domain-containing protein [Oscillospiraceae bacterium]